MNFSITDNKINDYTRPIQGAYQNNNVQQNQLRPEPEVKPTIQQQPPQDHFHPQVSRSVPVEQEQKSETPPPPPPKQIERRAKPLQLQRTRFQPRRRERVQEEQPVVDPAPVVVTQQDQGETRGETRGETKVENEFGYSIDE